MHTFAKYLFSALLPHDPDLSYKLALRAMRWVAPVQPDGLFLCLPYSLSPLSLSQTQGLHMFI
jgi:hypothetical protein